jgi:predicted glutamine amidotransferase
VCRLFGMHAGSRRLKATFWLLEAPDSLSEQSRRNPDGYGLATFAADGTPAVAKRPAAAYEDESFAREAREEESTTFAAHVRYASTGGKSVANTHPFEQEGRVFAHNGHVGGLDRLEERLGDYRSLVQGGTDSERVFALVTKEAAENGGDVGAAIHTAVDWIARELPLFALNVVLATPTDLWALRYPDTHELRVLERESGGRGGTRHLDAASPAGTVRVRSAGLAEQAAVVVASEQMDEDAGWRMLEPGELIHVTSQLGLSSTEIAEEPAHRLTLEDLQPAAAASQSKPAASASRG